MPRGLFGNYYVTPTATAIRRAWKLCKGSARDYQIIRRHALKLAHWPIGAEEPLGASGDLDWDWVRSLKRERIGELRIDETIAGLKNLRIIFFKANTVLPGDPKPRIWPMTVFPKTKQEFTRKEMRAWKGMRKVLVFRKYGNKSSA